MGRKVDSADKDKAIELYLAGKTVKEAAATFGMKGETLSTELRRRGIELRPRTVVPAAAVACYLDGASALHVAGQYGITRAALVRAVREEGHKVRDRSAAGKERAGRMTPEQREAQAAAAHEASRGRIHTEAERRKVAATRERKGRFDSPGERQLATELQARGRHPIPQKAIGRYNADMAVGDIAVEVLGGEWHGYKAIHRERTEAILNEGWNLVFVWNTPNYPLTAGAADYLIAFAEEAGRNPAVSRQYRVIRGDGKEVARGSAEDDTFAVIPPPRSGLDRSTLSRLASLRRWNGDQRSA